MAQNDLYNDCPTNGNTDSWTINFGFEVSNSFVLDSNSTVNGLNFEAWLLPGDVLESAEVSLTSEEAGGTTYFDQQVSFTPGRCAANQYGYNVCTESGIFPGVALNAGTYWLNLHNAVVNNGDPVFWDENSGPSSASDNSIGTIPGEAFTLLGSAGSGTGTTPEPETILLFGTGVAGLFGIFRRRLL